MKYILIAMFIFTAFPLYASEENNEAMLIMEESLISIYCDNPDFLSCTKIEHSTCSTAAANSLKGCDDEAYIAAISEILEAGHKSNDKTRKIMTDFGQCTNKNLFAQLKLNKAKYDSCFNSLLQKHYEDAKTKYNKKKH